MIYNFTIWLFVCLFFLEMHCDVYGPVYGCLEYSVTCLQLPVAEGKVTYLSCYLLLLLIAPSFFKLPLISIPDLHPWPHLAPTGTWCWGFGRCTVCIGRGGPPTSEIIPHRQGRKQGGLILFCLLLFRFCYGKSAWWWTMWSLIIEFGKSHKLSVVPLRFCSNIYTCVYKRLWPHQNILCPNYYQAKTVNAPFVPELEIHVNIKPAVAWSSYPIQTS